MIKRKEFFESFAADWDKNITAEDTELIAHLSRSFKLKAGDKVADLGCGTGVLFDVLRRIVGPAGIIVGIDFAFGMVRKAQGNFPFKNCLVINADAQWLPLKSGVFDMAISLAAFPHFPNPEQVMNEVSRILKKNGHFYIIHLLSSKELRHHHENAGGPVAMDNLPSMKKMIQLFEQNHFLKVTITDRPGLYVASGVKK
ncbi:MAG: class I SAM-dependent methyltransferase [candidate division Zixibacteria bacterium]|nr:class I SAM-dependent methyltransferase [candidate division Zixibacteria bacterium]